MHFVEVGSQEDLVNTLPKLYNDLLNKNTDTLKDFVVPMKRIIISMPTGELVKHIVDLMCIEAADGILLQCGREYGFGPNSGSEKLRATDISALTPEQRKGLGTNNLKTERNLSVWDPRAEKSAKRRNYKYKAKSLRNDMMLYMGNQGIVEQSSRKLTKLLDEREKRWNDAQKEKAEERIESKLSQALRTKDYTRKLLIDCKSWSGPFTSPQEMLRVINERPDRAEHILRTEIAYLAHTQRTDKIARPGLYKINNLSFDEKLENLYVLLFDETTSDCTATIADLPTNKKVLNTLTSNIDLSISQSRDLMINELCVVVWLSNDKYIWQLAYVKESNEKVLVDHLYPVDKKSTKHWKYPTHPEVCSVLRDQILDVQVEGEWNSLGSRLQKYTLFNEKEIISEFKRFCDANID